MTARWLAKECNLFHDENPPGVASRALRAMQAASDVTDRQRLLSTLLGRQARSGEDLSILRNHLAITTVVN